jgi:glyoxylase-like metal-dependent hydrolase (beta-lactamase superfamily II)
VVDTGVSGSQAAIGDVIKSVGREWSEVRHLILTHHHGDHAGSMAEVLAAASNAVAYAGAADVESILSRGPVKPVNDGDDVFGLRMIATPGHTAGHIVVHDPAGRVVIAGDALNNQNGALSGPNARFTADMALAIQSVAKIGALDFETLYVGHGDPIEGGAAQAVTALAERLK